MALRLFPERHFWRETWFESNHWRRNEIMILIGPSRQEIEELENLGQEFFAGSRKHWQKLLERVERFAHLELHRHAGEALDVGDPWRKVVRVVPRPWLAPVVVVVQVPLDGSNVAFSLFRKVSLNYVVCNHKAAQCSTLLSRVPIWITCFSYLDFR